MIIKSGTEPLNWLNRFLTLSFGLLCTSIALADGDCTVVSSSAQVDQCAEVAKTNADTQLNARYHELMERLEAHYQRDSAMGAEHVAKVKEAQRAWVKLRDANCVVEAFEIDADTPAHRTVVNKCIERMSLERAVELDRIAPFSAADRAVDAICPANEFPAFLTAFSERLEVQRAYVKQPLQLVTTVPGDPEPGLEKRSVSDDQIKFPLIPGREKRDAEGLTLTVKEVQGNSATAILQKPDTDYVFEYRFVRGACWVLEEVLDFSL